MKKNMLNYKKLVTTCLFLFFGLIMLWTSSLAASCPNGCVDNGSGCYCNFWFPTYDEFDWGDATSLQ